MEASILSSDMVDARVAPKGSLEHLSQQEIAKLLDSGQGGLYPLFRKCALAVLNSGSDTAAAPLPALVPDLGQSVVGR